MSYCSQTFYVIFWNFYWIDDIWRIWKNLRKNRIELEIQYNDDKKLLILTLIYWQISIEKYIPKFLIITEEFLSDIS